MIKDIIATDVYDEKRQFCFKVEFPKKCPHCGISAIFCDKSAYVHKREVFDPLGKATVTYLCPSCEKMFVVEYYGQIDQYSIMDTVEIIPQSNTCEDTAFSDEVNELSPEFVEIYKQAYRAECAGMSKICGMGYRKALEFLIKDYAIQKMPNESERIVKMRLSDCINNCFEDNPKIQTLAKASVWLGNDETHYIKQHETYSIKDLKVFIDVMVAYVDMELQYKKAVQFIENK